MVHTSEIPEIRTYYKDEFNSIEDEIYAFFEEEKHNTGQLSYNYTPESLGVMDQSAITLGRDSDGICVHATILNREVFGKNAVRCLNRLYKKPKYRYDSDKIIERLIYEHLEVTRNLGYHWCVMTRKYPGRYSMKKFFSKHFLDKSQCDWHVSDHMHLVCNNRNAKGCWQDICYTSVVDSPDELEMLRNKISLDNYRNLEGRK